MITATMLSGDAARLACRTLALMLCLHPHAIGPREYNLARSERGRRATASQFSPLSHHRDPLISVPAPPAPASSLRGKERGWHAHHIPNRLSRCTCTFLKRSPNNAVHEGRSARVRLRSDRLMWLLDRLRLCDARMAPARDVASGNFRVSNRSMDSRVSLLLIAEKWIAVSSSYSSALIATHFTCHLEANSASQLRHHLHEMRRIEAQTALSQDLSSASPSSAHHLTPRPRSAPRFETAEPHSPFPSHSVCGKWQFGKDDPQCLQRSHYPATRAPWARLSVL